MEAPVHIRPLEPARPGTMIGRQPAARVAR